MSEPRPERPSPVAVVARRAEIHAALGGPARLALVDELRLSDRSPGELAALFDLAPNLLTFHLDTLERAGVVRRSRSGADGRRKYVTFVRGNDAAVAPPIGLTTALGPVVFVCTHNSARSQLAAALWEAGAGTATSAGTEPAAYVHPGAVAAARRAGLHLDGGPPRRLGSIDEGRRVITVCDRAHEQLPHDELAWHWSIPDPAAEGTDAAFDRALDFIRTRIAALL